MATISDQTGMPPIIGRKLREVRWQVRAFVWLEGLAAVVILVGVAFWLGLGLDWWLEPPPGVRLAALVLLAAASGRVIYRQLVRRAFVPLADASLAVLLERKFARLQDDVLTAVDMAAGNATDAYHPELVLQTNRAAAKAMAGVRPLELFQQAPLARAVAMAAVLVASIPIFAIVQNEAFQFWLQRVALSSELWPRQVHLEVVGFPVDEHGQRTHKIAQDDSFELLVHADATDHVVPEQVELRFRLADGRNGRDTMIRVGEAVRGRDDAQLFRYEFKHVAADMTLDVVGGDDRIRGLRLQVVDRPKLVGMEIACEYPPYLGRPARRLPITGGMRIPEGTRLTLRATPTKPLADVRVRSSQASRDDVLVSPQLQEDQIVWEYGTLSADDVLSIEITDHDGISGREPYRVSLSAIPDERPQIAVRLAGVGTAITPDAVLPITGKIVDDYGLKRIWFAYRVDDGEEAERPFRQQPRGNQTVTELDRFDTRDVDAASALRALSLEPGQTLYLSVGATDWYDLTDDPRAGSSPRFALDVVTEAKLLAMLERRELELRQRFESIYNKVTDTRNLLGRVDFNERPADSADETTATDAADENAEPTDEAPAAAERAQIRRRLRVAGSLQNVTQAAHEMLGVADGFDDIHDQLENNRVDNADLKSRLREQIAGPIRQLGESRMTELESRLQLVQENISNTQAGAPALATAIELADEILVEMQQVLERMLELESYNEVVALLRGIIKDQQEINERTKRQRTERLQSLLDN